MPFPSTITTITVFGQYVKADGGPASGEVRFTPSISAATSGAIMPVLAYSTQLGPSGSFSVDLAATDDPDWIASGFTYLVTEHITGATQRSYNITVPAATPMPAGLDLATVVPVASVVPVATYVLTSDSRLTDARAPTPHKSTHATGGSDVLAKADIGLGNVDNTSDTSKPISTATQTALDGKLSLTGGTLSGALNTDTLTANNLVTIVRAATSNNILLGRITTDTVARIGVFASGSVEWGPGGATPRDVSLSRAATAQLRVTPTDNASASTSVGGAFNITNTANTGAGLVVFSSQAAPVGHLAVFRTNSATWNQSGIFVDYVGTQHGVNITHAGTGANSSAMNILSTNTANTAVKVTHTGQADGSDSAASCLSLDIRTAGTASQGIFVTATDGPTTGSLITLRNNARDDFVVKGTGRVGIGVPSGGAVGAAVDIRQNDDATVGLRVRGFSGASSDLLTLEDSTSVVKFRVAKDGAAFVNGADLTIQGVGKAYRLRRGGNDMDFEGTGSKMFLSVWSGTNFDGTQRQYMVMEAAFQVLQLLGRVDFRDIADGSVIHQIDASTGVASLGKKNGLANIQFCGAKATAGAPTTGAWNTGDVVLDSAGVWHRCTAGGTPGTWT